MPRATDTKAQIFDLVRAAGQTSQAELVERTGLTGATISTITRQLIDDGLLTETGRARSTGGKPRTLVGVVPDAMHAVGVHLTRTDLVLVITDLLGGVIARTRREVPLVQDDSDLADILVAAIDEIIRGTGLRRADVSGVGLVVSGPVSAGALGAHLSPDVPRLRDALSSRLSMPVLLDNDASAAALGEWWVSGVGRTEDALVVYLGSGIGGGLVTGGKLQRGVFGNAGELGHVTVDLNGPLCTCGARGCLEVIAGPSAVVRAALAEPTIAVPGGLDNSSTQDGVVECSFAAIAHTARLGNGAARLLLEEAAHALAVAVRSVVNVIDIAEVVLTGPSAAVAGATYLGELERELERAYSRHFGHSVGARLSQNCGTAAALGAASMALDAAVRPAAHES